MNNFLDQLMDKRYILQKQIEKMEKELKNANDELVAFRHLSTMAVKAVEELALRLRNRLPDDMSAWPGDRAALLNADLVLSEAYKTNGGDWK